MPKSPLDDFPPPNPKLFRRKIERNLEEALRSLDKFSDSIRDRKAPAWPREATYELFMAQLDAFRCISKRKENAPPIQVMREIDRTWHKLSVVGTVDRCVEHLQAYLGNNSLGSVIAQELFELRHHPAKDQLISLVCKTRLAGPRDVGVIRSLPLPKPFQELDTLAFDECVKRAPVACGGSLRKLRTAVARAAQEYLFSDHLRYMEKCAAAKTLRSFIFGLNYRPYKKKLFGSPGDVIEKWKERDRKEPGRLRQEKLRKKRAQEALRLT
jgi:hypothetical protein